MPTTSNHSLIEFERDKKGRPIRVKKLHFHSGQWKAWKSQSRFVFMLAGTQGGKTSFGPWWLHKQIMETRSPGGDNDYIAATANYSLYEKKMLPEMLKVFCQYLKMGRFHKGARIIELRDPATGLFWSDTGSEMYGRILLAAASTGSTKDAGVAGLESATAKAAWLDEVGLVSFGLNAWEAVLRRLSLAAETGGKVLGTTTLYNFGWLRTEVYDRWVAGDPNYDVIQFDSIMNPNFPISEYLRARDTLPPWKFNMLYRGRFDRPATQIYLDFDPARHVVNPRIIPVHWPIIVGVDPGAVNTGIVYLARDPTLNVYHVWNETMQGNLTSTEHVRRIKHMTERYMYRKYVGGAKSEQQFRMDWQDAGLNIYEPEVFDVEQGIDRVIQLFKANKLFVHRTCSKTVSQLIEYARVIDDRGEATEKIQDKEKYHLLDALRYACSVIRLHYQHTPPMPSRGDQRLPSFGSTRDGIPSMM